MCWPFATFAKVVGGAHDPFTEMVLPESIDQNSGGQWMIRPAKPTGQLQSTTAFSNRSLPLARQDSRKAAWYRFARLFVVAA